VAKQNEKIADVRPGVDAGSFRDPENRVYRHGDRILRGLSAQAGDIYRKVAAEPFYAGFVERRMVVPTAELDADQDQGAAFVKADGWPVVLEHEAIPFISYPYEWSFSMLRDAALLQLDLIEDSIENGWTLKDASPYNIQWVGAQPTFIDIGSFEPRIDGEPWIGYRQFCSMFLIPLMLKAHLGIDYAPLLRSKLDGIPPLEAAKYFHGLSRFKAGAVSHVWLPAKVERSIATRERDRTPARQRRGGNHSIAMVLGLIQGLKRTVRRLKWNVQHTDWSQYATSHSYQDEDFAAKVEFVSRHAAAHHRGSVWDIGCNTGTFSKLVAPHADFVLAVDGDHDSIEQLYAAEKAAGGTRILPMVMDLANVSPNQGWHGRERMALDNRRKPDLVLCLALIHHMRVSANVPIPLFLDWLASLGSSVIIEFVDREDEMFKKILANKTVDYADYTLANFVAEAEARFVIKDRQVLKSGHREIFLLEPR
jgi:SAM-dependent methyltransferase